MKYQGRKVLVHSTLSIALLGLISTLQPIHAQTSPAMEDQSFASFKANLIAIAKSNQIKPEIINHYLAPIQFSPASLNFYYNEISTNHGVDNSDMVERHDIIFRNHPEAQQIIHKLDEHQSTDKNRSTDDLMLRPQLSLNLSYLIDLYAKNLPLYMAQQQYQQHQKMLMVIQNNYGVPAGDLIAIWGCETGWGNDVGNFNIINSLTTLAFDANYKQTFYANNLDDFIDILNEQTHPIIPQQLISTFDGGMGYPQFEPENYFQYAVDFDQDGFANIWTSVPDSLASIANLLVQNGWTFNEPMLYKSHVVLTQSLLDKAKSNEILTIQDWQKLGLTLDPIYKNDHINLQQTAHLLVPEGREGPFYLATHNYDVFFTYWNHSQTEAMMVYIMSELLQHPNLTWDYFKS